MPRSADSKVAAAIKNIETAAGILTNLVRDLQTREVLAGRVLRYEPMAGNVPRLAGHLAGCL